MNLKKYVCKRFEMLVEPEITAVSRLHPKMLYSTNNKSTVATWHGEIRHHNKVVRANGTSQAPDLLHILLLLSKSRPEPNPEFKTCWNNLAYLVKSL